MISVLELAKKDDAKVVFTINSGIYEYCRDTWYNTYDRLYQENSRKE